MMTAVSFITVDHASLMREHHNHDFSDTSRTVDSHVVASHDTVSIVLISDALHLSELRPMRFRCKVIHNSLVLICYILIVLFHLLLCLSFLLFMCKML